MIKGFSLGTHHLARHRESSTKRTSKVMEIVNVVIDETLTSTTQKEVDQLPKFTLPSALMSDKVEEDSPPASTPHIA